MKYDYFFEKAKKIAIKKTESVISDFQSSFSVVLFDKYDEPFFYTYIFDQDLISLKKQAFDAGYSFITKDSCDVIIGDFLYYEYDPGCSVFIPNSEEHKNKLNFLYNFKLYDDLVPMKFYWKVGGYHSLAYLYVGEYYSFLGDDQSIKKFKLFMECNKRIENGCFKKFRPEEYNNYLKLDINLSQLAKLSECIENNYITNFDEYGPTRFNSALYYEINTDVSLNKIKTMDQIMINSKDFYNIYMHHGQISEFKECCYLLNIKEKKEDLVDIAKFNLCTMFR